MDRKRLFLTAFLIFLFTVLTQTIGYEKIISGPWRTST